MVYTMALVINALGSRHTHTHAHILIHEQKQFQENRHAPACDRRMPKPWWLPSLAYGYKIKPLSIKMNSAYLLEHTNYANSFILM